MLSSCPFDPIRDQQKLRHGHRRNTLVYRIIIISLSLLVFTSLIYIAFEKAGDHDVLKRIEEGAEDAGDFDVDTGAEGLAVFCLHVKKSIAKVYVCVDMYGVNVSGGGLINKAAAGIARKAINAVVSPEIFDSLARSFQIVCACCACSIALLSLMQLVGVLTMAMTCQNARNGCLSFIAGAMSGALQIATIAITLITLISISIVFWLRARGAPGVGISNINPQGAWYVLLSCSIVLCVISYLNAWIWGIRVYVCPCCCVYRGFQKRHAYDAEVKCPQHCTCGQHLPHVSSKRERRDSLASFV